MLVDSHCHLDFPDFADELAEVLDRARRAGVGRMLTICTRLDRLAPVLALAEAHGDVWCAVGVHPHEAAAAPDLSEEAMVEIARHPKVVAIGECGLDYHYDHSPRDAQAESFRIQLRAARRAGLPAVVHTREADADTAAILREVAEEGGGAPLRGVIHCFSSGHQLADAALGLGFMLSFSGILTFNRSEEIRSVAAAAPADRILVETDAPYLAPVPRRGRRNEPAFVVHTAARLAALRGLDEEEIAQLTTANFHRLFDKVPAPS
jgi:TatD DNase family protein